MSSGGSSLASKLVGLSRSTSRNSSIENRAGRWPARKALSIPHLPKYYWLRRDLHPVAGMAVGPHRVALTLEPIRHEITVDDLLGDAIVHHLAALHGDVARGARTVANRSLMRDGAAGNRAQHRQSVTIVAAAELPADRGADDGACGRRARHTVGANGLANDLVPALLARAIHRDIADHGLDVDDAGGDDGR